MREQSLSSRFNYMILQAYDFLELNAAMRCFVADGPDRINGAILSTDRPDPPACVGPRDLPAEPPPLLTTSDGRQNGKSKGGASLADGDMLSPYEFLAVLAASNDRDADTGKFFPQDFYRATGRGM